MKGGRRRGQERGGQQGQQAGYKAPEPSLKEKAVASVRRPRMPVVSSRGEKKVVAFGGRAPVLAASKKGAKERDSDLLKNGLKLAKKNIGNRRNQEYDKYDHGVMKRQEQKGQQQLQKSPARSGGGGGGGFGGLMNSSKNGPVVVTYDDEGQGGSQSQPDHGHRNSNTNSNQYHSPVQKQNAKRSNMNLELRGSSHHLPVEGDAINGDELDSLLNKARNIRRNNN